MDALLVDSSQNGAQIAKTLLPRPIRHTHLNTLTSILTLSNFQEEKLSMEIFSHDIHR